MKRGLKRVRVLKCVQFFFLFLFLEPALLLVVAPARVLLRVAAAGSATVTSGSKSGSWSGPEEPAPGSDKSRIQVIDRIKYQIQCPVARFV